MTSFFVPPCPSPSPINPLSHPTCIEPLRGSPTQFPMETTSGIITPHPSHSSPLESVHPSPLFIEAEFPPLVTSGPVPLSPHSPVTSPSFSDPSLQKSLSIFSDKTPLSPSVLPLDSIHFENVTIRRKKKNKSPLDAVDLVPTPYTPLSTRLKLATRKPSSSPQRVLRDSSPQQIDS